MSYIEMNSSMSILLVDGSPSEAQRTRELLRNLGYNNVRMSHDALEAFEYLKAKKVDFLISRVSLPTISGIELKGLIDNEYSIMMIPFLFASEAAGREDLAKLGQQGVENHVTMPCVPKTLAQALTRAWIGFRNPSIVEMAFDKARKLIVDRQYDEASKILKSLAQHNKLPERALMGLARIAMRKGNIDLAIKICDMVREKYPLYVYAHDFKGEVLLSQTRESEALQCFQAASALSPRNTQRYRIMEEILMCHGAHGEVIAMYREAKSKGIEFAIVDEGIGKALLSLGRLEEAAQVFTSLIGKGANKAGYFDSLGLCMLKSGDLPRAIFNFNKALAADPHYLLSMYHLAITHAENCSEQQAINILKEVVAQDSNFHLASEKLAELTSKRRD